MATQIPCADFNLLYPGRKSRSPRWPREEKEHRLGYTTPNARPEELTPDPDMTSLEILNDKATRWCVLSLAYSSDLRLIHQFNVARAKGRACSPDGSVCIFHVIPNVGGCAQGMKEEVLQPSENSPENPIGRSGFFKVP